MVAQKRGRGGKAQAAKGKAAAAAAAATATEEQLLADPETVEAEEAAPENNGDASQPEAAEAEGNAAGNAAGDQQTQEGNTEGQENVEGEEKPEEKKEEKVESGKLVVENLPSSFLFDYQEKVKELFSKHGEILSVKRGPIIVTELTTTPTLSAIVEFKNKESLDKALSEEGTVIEGNAISVAAQSRAETAVLVGVPYEATTDYVRTLFAQCGEVAHIHEFSKTKYKILRVTFHATESVEKALKLDRELRINGFLVTVSKYRDDDEQKAHNASSSKNKRQHPQNQNRNSNVNANANNNANNSRPNNNNFRARGGAANNFNARGNFRGGRGRGGFAGRGNFRGGFAPPAAPYLPPQPFMGRPQGGFMNDGQRPNKRLRQI